MALAPELTEGLLGSVWIPAAAPMAVLALWGAIRSLGAATGPLFKSLGKPHLIALFQGVKLAVLLISVIPLAVRFGITGAAVSSVLSACIVFPLAMGRALRLTGSTAAELLNAVGPAGFSAAAAAVPVAVFKHFLRLHPLAVCAAGASAGAVLYAGLLLVCWRFMGFPTPWAVRRSGAV
jgi:PST family polysaccharide transporter/lipopolysaccharide exporter